YPSWQNFPVVKHISGKPGGEGEIVLLRKEERGFTFPAYYAITIKIDEGRRLLWKTYPEKITPDDNFFGIVDFKVSAMGAATRFSYDFLYEFVVPSQDEGKLEAYRKEQYRNFEALFQAIFPKLKKLAEQSA